MQTREQRYAARTMSRMEAVCGRPQAFQKQYGSLCHKLPVLILSAGLAQALAFLLARASSGPAAEGSRSGKEGVLTFPSAHHQLLVDLAWVLELPTSPGEGVMPASLLQQVQRASFLEYMRQTRLSLGALVWFKRFAQSLLQVEAADEAPEPSSAGGLHE